jgi:hypothetical protein
MSGFWPSGLDLGDTASPKAILETAKGEWETESDGRLTLVIRDSKSESGNKMILVYAKSIPENKTTALFSVVHRPTASYPVTIQPEKDYLPDCLKKSYKRQNLTISAHIAASIADMSGQPVEKTIMNEWVAETPSEFRTKLYDAFNLGTVKSAVLGLVVGSETDNNDTGCGECDNPSTESE